jgi:hypothetical protein
VKTTEFPQGTRQTLPRRERNILQLGSLASIRTNPSKSEQIRANPARRRSATPKPLIWANRKRTARQSGAPTPSWPERQLGKIWHLFALCSAAAAKNGDQKKPLANDFESIACFPIAVCRRITAPWPGCDKI